jgi:hypothetical protein
MAIDAPFTDAPETEPFALLPRFPTTPGPKMREPIMTCPVSKVQLPDATNVHD